MVSSRQDCCFERNLVRIATYNVNGINGRLPVLLRWLKEDAPDIVCLQELKSPNDRFPRAELEHAGYGAVWHGQKSWNGVAILAKGLVPLVTRRGLPGDPDAQRHDHTRRLPVVAGARRPPPDHPKSYLPPQAERCPPLPGRLLPSLPVSRRKYAALLLRPRHGVLIAQGFRAHLGQQPGAKRLDLRHVAAALRIGEPVVAAVVAEDVEGLDQAAGGDGGVETVVAGGSAGAGW